MTFVQRYYQVRNRILREIYATPFWQIPSEITYKAALEKYADELPLLSPSDLTLVDILKREGICITSLEALGIPSTPLISTAVEKILPKLKATLPFHKNQYVIHASPAQIMEYPELFLWGAEERLLNIVENYLGLPVAYHGLYFRKDIANNIQVKSRLWHLDMEDRRLCKIIIYLNDVNDESGPFEYIPKQLTSFLSHSLKYNYGYIQDRSVESFIPKSNWKSCTGASGTVIIVDTASIFHRGKIPLETDRFTLFFDYTSRQPKHRYYCKSSLSQNNLLALEPILSKYQKECIFWR